MCFKELESRQQSRVLKRDPESRRQASGRGGLSQGDRVIRIPLINAREEYLGIRRCQISWFAFESVPHHYFLAEGVFSKWGPLLFRTRFPCQLAEKSFFTPAISKI